jgi:beta-xylosidase
MAVTYNHYKKGELSNMKRKISLFSLIGMLVFVSFTYVFPRSAEAATINLTADYNSNTDTYDKSKLLNASQGGYVAAKNTNFLPEQYDNYAEAGLQLIRLDHLFDPGYYNIVQGTSPNYTYNFDQLDKVVLPLLAKGMKPFMTLSYTPSQLGAWNVMPNSMTDWQNIVKALVQHYKTLGYTGWYWEVWNEPVNFFAGTPADFNTLYVNTATAVKAIDATALVGGNGEASHVSTFLTSLLDYIQSHPTVPFDFVSYHTYGETDTDWNSVDAMQTMLNNRGLGSKPILANEWNYTYNMANGPGSAVDTNFLGAYAAKKMYLASMKSNLSKIFYFSPTEGWNVTQRFNGDLGLLTVDNHRKAVFNVTKMYNNMFTTKLTTVVSGNADNNTYGFATKDTTSTSTSLIAWNNTNVTNTFMITENNLPYAAAGKNILVTGYLVDAVHGNYYQDYARGLRGYSIGPSESMDPIESSIIASSSTFTRTITLAPYSVVQYLLAPTASAVNAGPIIPNTFIPNPNLAAGKSVSSSSSAEDFGWYKAALTDELTHSVLSNAGNGSMGWTSWPASSVPTQTQSVTVDLGVPTDINRVVAYGRDDQGYEGINFPLDFSIKGSNDGVNFTQIAGTARTNYNSGVPVVGPQTFNFSPVNYRYLRFEGTKLNGTTGNYLMQLAELQAYNTIAKVNLALNSPIAASSLVENFGWFKAKLVDGQRNSVSGANGYSSQVSITTNHTEWIEINMPSVKTFSGVTLFPRNDAGYIGEGFPMDFKIQVWNGSTWLDRVVKTGYAKPGNAGQTFTWGFADNTDRLRIYATNLRQVGADGYMLQLAEVEVNN